MRRTLAVLALSIAAPLAALADSAMQPPEGWRIVETQKDYATLLADLKEAVRANRMGVVTEAGPTEVARQRGETIAGNRVVGVFRNDFAVTIIRAAPAAMIEAPVRIMVLEEADGTASLGYALPSTRFAPYMAEGGDTLRAAAAELDDVFEAITDAAAR